jgi:hypothetical protein
MPQTGVRKALQYNYITIKCTQMWNLCSTQRWLRKLLNFSYPQYRRGKVHLKHYYIPNRLYGFTLQQTVIFNATGSVIQHNLYLSSPTRPYRLWEPRSLLTISTATFLQRVKRLGREAGRSPPSGGDDKTAWSYSANRMRLHGEAQDTWTALLCVTYWSNWS